MGRSSLLCGFWSRRPRSVKCSLSDDDLGGNGIASDVADIDPLAPAAQKDVVNIGWASTKHTRCSRSAHATRASAGVQCHVRAVFCFIKKLGLSRFETRVGLSLLLYGLVVLGRLHPSRLL